jgi:hypothetical protein
LKEIANSRKKVGYNCWLKQLEKHTELKESKGLERVIIDEKPIKKDEKNYFTDKCY